jgi:4-amino-4-deoxy-L-arabinose transferase-like glycosyltransferase
MMDRQPHGGESAYIGHAQRLLGGAGYVDPSGRPSSYWPVGYPATLALAYLVGGDGFLTAAVFNALCGTATVVLIFLLASSLFGPRVGQLSGMLIATYPNHVFFASLRLSEPLFTLLLVAAAFVLLGRPTRERNAMAAGLLVGLAALTRPGITLFPLMLPVW